MNNLKYIFLSVLAVIVISCKYEFPEEAPNQPKPRAGSADFTKYVAVGNSLTAGYMDGALYDRGQKNSYPAILAHQFDTVGGGEFIQPDIDSENGFYRLIQGATLGRLTLKYGCPNGVSPSPSPLPGTGIGQFSGDVTKLNNFGIPGIKLIYASSGAAASQNPYYSRWFKSTGDAIATSPIALASNSGATFFSMWLGNNDVLAYATAGGTVPSSSSPSSWNDAPSPPQYIGVDGGGNPISNPAYPSGASYYKTLKQASQNGISANDMTPSGVFSGAYNSSLTTLIGSSAKCVVANIPDVTNIPYFTTIPAAALSIPLNLGDVIPPQAGPPLGGKTYAQVLNELYFQYGFTTQKELSEGIPFKPDNKNYLVIETFDANGKRIVRQIDPVNDLIVLPIPTDSLGLGPIIKCGAPTSSIKSGWGLAKNIPLTAEGKIDLAKLNPSNIKPYPIPSTYVLDKAEKDAVSQRIIDFNIAISTTANNERVVMVDIYSIFKSIAGGTSINGINFNTTISPPYGGFSLDGVHPNARGSAFIANEFIKAINSKFGSTVPLVNPNNYPGNDLPR